MAYHLFMHLFILLHHSQKQIHGLLSINNSRRGSKLNSSSLHKTVTLTQFLHICCWVAEAACNLLAFFILLWTTYCIEQATRAQESCFGCVIASICRLQFQNQGCLSAKSDQVVQKPGICRSYEYNMNARLETGLWFLYSHGSNEGILRIEVMTALHSFTGSTDSKEGRRWCT